MGLGAEDLAWVRSYVPWTPPADADLSARYDAVWSERSVRPGYVPADYPRDDQIAVRVAVATWYVRARLSAMLDDPSSFSVDGGEYSESWSSNIIGLRERLKELQEMGGDAAEGGAAPGVTSVGVLVREGGFREPYGCAPEGRGFR